MNYGSTANIEEVMKFYNLDHKTFETDFSFSDSHGQKFSQQQEPGLREKITENMINIWIFNWQGIFSNTYYTKLAFQTP